MSTGNKTTPKAKNAGMQRKGIAGRDHNLDLIKAVAILCVVAVHQAASAFDHPIGSFNWLSGNFWSTFLRGSVPLFLMCSGVVFLDPGREITPRKIFLKYIPRILAALFFWAFLYKLYHLAFAGTLTVPNLWHAVKELFLFKHQNHLYYLHIILLVYAMVPVLRVFTRSASEKELRYALLIWFVFGILYPTLRGFWPFTLLTGVPNQWMLNMTWSSLGYILLGHYLRRYRPFSRNLSAGLFALGFALCFFGVWLLSVRKGSLDSTFTEGMSVSVALKSMGFFAFVDSLKLRDNRALRVATYLSRASFCIYLAHIFFLWWLAYAGLSAAYLLPLLSIPAATAANVLLCLLVYLIFSHIPIVKKWLV